MAKFLKLAALVAVVYAAWWCGTYSANTSQQSTARAAETTSNAPATPKTITIEQLSDDYVIIGDLGKPIYETLTLEIQVDDAHKGESGEMASIYSVNGVQLARPERMNWQWCKTEHQTKLAKNKRYTVRAYQDGIVQVGYQPCDLGAKEFPAIRCNFGSSEVTANLEPLAADGGKSQVVGLDVSSATSTTGPILTPTLNIPFTQGSFSEQPGDTSNFWFKSKLVIYSVVEKK